MQAWRGLHTACIEVPACPTKPPCKVQGGRSSSAKTALVISSMTRVTPLCTLMCPPGAGEMLCPGTSNLQEERFGGVSWVPPHPPRTPTLPCTSPGQGVPKLT